MISALQVRKVLWGLQVLLDRKVPQVPKVLREIQVRKVLRDLRALQALSVHKVLSVRKVRQGNPAHKDRRVFPAAC